MITLPLYSKDRVFMINKYGLEYVEKLEATRNESRSYSIEYYQKLIRVVRKKIKKMMENRRTIPFK